VTLSPKEQSILSLIRADAAYENYFFKKVTDIKWFYPLKEMGYFSPDNAPGPAPADQPGYFTIPEWNVLSYLERVSEKTSLEARDYIEELLKIIKDVSEYRDSSGRHIDNYRTWYFFVKILYNIPNQRIPVEILQLIPGWLDSQFDTSVAGSEITTKLLPKFLTEHPEDIRKSEILIQCITEIKTIQLSEERAKILDKKEEVELVIDPYWLKEAFDKHSQIIGEKCSEDIIKDLTKKIRNLLKREEEGTYESFYEQAEYPVTDPLRVLTDILKRLLAFKALSNETMTEQILKEFLRDRYLLFPKIGLYIIGNNIDRYSKVFWEIMESDVGVTIMGTILYIGDELKHLLSDLKELSEKQRDILQKNIKEAADRHTFREDKERYKCVYKQEIYQALLQDAYFRTLYDEMKTITKVDVELHPAVKGGMTRVGPGPSPFSKEEILTMPSEKLANYLISFRTKDFWTGPTVGGLAGVVGEVAKESPEHFTDDLHCYIDTGYIYVYRILGGIRDAWNNKKSLNWDNVLQFIKAYIDRREFWEDRFIVEEGEWLGGANHQWIIGVVAELISDGTRDDAWAFGEEYFEKAKEIIFLILNMLKPEEEKDIGDYVTYTLNTPLGKTIVSLLLLALRIARGNEKKGIKRDVRWPSEFKEKYDQLLSAGIAEAFTNLGRYLPNCNFLDKEWTNTNIKQMSKEMGNRNWEAFMCGYFSIGQVYSDLYESMKPHYEFGLSYPFKAKHDREYLIQHICVRYLQSKETLHENRSLFRKIIDVWETGQILEVIGFFWMQRGFLKAVDDENRQIKAKIIDFWKVLFEKYKDKDEDALNQKDKEILSSASKLAIFLPRIDDESYQWLMLSAAHIHVGFNAHAFIEYLDAIKAREETKDTAKYIGEIYLKLIERKLPDYDRVHIRSIVDYLFQAGETDPADKICEIYGRKDYDFLRDIWDKFH
jgi:hypothetical protein